MKPKTNNKKYIVPILSLIVSVLIFSIGYVIGRAGFSVAFEKGEVNYTFKGQLYPEEEDINFDMFWDVWGKLESRYVEKNIDEKEMFYGAIKGMVRSLDDVGTYFLTPEEVVENEKDKAGKLEGIGVLISYYKERYIFADIFDGTPASESGLEVGDVIVSVDGQDVDDLLISEVSEVIKGQKGTEVEIRIERKGQQKTFNIQRDQVQISSIQWEMLENDIALIKILRFTESSEEQFYYKWDRAIDSIMKNSPKGVIIDLRGNTGGFLDGAVYLAGEFIPEGEVVLYERGREGNVKVKKVDRTGRMLDMPVGIIVNSSTASASEIFAGALQYYDRAEIIGEKTYGKGVASIVVEPPASWGGAGLVITTQKWLLPDKRWINTEDPIYPDVKSVLDVSIEEYQNGKDNQLEDAINQLN